MVVQALGGNAVEAVAVGAGDEQWVRHVGGPVKNPISPIWRRLLTFSIVQGAAIKLG
jgi:hypothetical protein